MYLHVPGYRHLHLNRCEVSHAGTKSFKELLFQQQLVLIASVCKFAQSIEQENAKLFPHKTEKSVTSNNHAF